MLKEIWFELKRRYPITTFATLIGGIIGLLFIFFGVRLFYLILGLLLGFLAGRLLERKR